MLVEKDVACFILVITLLASQLIEKEKKTFDVVIMDIPVDRRCFFSFSIDLLWFPARRCVISGTLVVPLVVFFL